MRSDSSTFENRCHTDFCSVISCTGNSYECVEWNPRSGWRRIGSGFVRDRNRTDVRFFFTVGLSGRANIIGCLGVTALSTGGFVVFGTVGTDRTHVTGAVLYTPPGWT